MPDVRSAPRVDGPLLPAPQRLHPLTDTRPTGEAVLDLLANGALSLEGRLVDASNATFYCRLTPAAADSRPMDGVACVYKPIRGERPLDDFPDGTLARRERAAYLLSESLGWRIVPPTVLRDGPFGEGMVQLWIESDPAADVVAMVLGSDPRLRRVAVFDVLANNADRKGSHLLPLPDGHVHAVDHGVTFATAPKLRTVLWGWRGQPLEDDEVAAVARVAADLEAGLGEALLELLSPAEVGAAHRRAAQLLRRRRFPLPDPSRPALPWPPF